MNSDSNVAADFAALTPDAVLDAVEAATGQQLTAFTQPLPSYINRVYELQTVTGERIVAKFYRPGRWSVGALRDEHDFVLACEAEEIPVVAPMQLQNGDTLDCFENIYLAVYPKRSGRVFEPTEEEDWRRLGRLVARVHAVGNSEPAKNRITLDPAISTSVHIQELLHADLIDERWQRSFRQLAENLLQIVQSIFAQFAPASMIRVHGDCHRGNIMERPDEGLLLIDFDDMAMGPPVQDLWMLLPEHVHKCEAELELILEGYRLFREFDERTIRLIEPLRAMRMLYFLAWCGRQVGDPGFERTFPGWGSSAFWARETNDLQEQLAIIHETAY